MISKAAESAIMDMWDAGLRPTVADIIRLNAVGLRLENRMKPSESLYHLRRCAFLGEGDARVVLREPLLGHEIWRDRVRSLVDFADVFTVVTVDAFLCGVELEDLPDPENAVLIRAAVQAFADRCKAFPVGQIASAVLYCRDGVSWLHGESAAEPPPPDDAEPIDDSFSFPVGVIRNGIAIGVGLTLKEAQHLTRAAFGAMVARRLRYDDAVDRKAEHEQLDDDYLRTLDEITDRLKAEKEAAHG